MLRLEFETYIFQTPFFKFYLYSLFLIFHTVALQSIIWLLHQHAFTPPPYSNP